MRAVRLAAAAWLVVSTPWLLPTFTMQRLREIYAHLPELTLASIVAAPLPGLVGLLSAVRWFAGRPHSASPLAVATRWASILALLGLMRPFDAHDTDSAFTELVLRATQLVALLFLFDGPVVPEEGESASGPRAKTSEGSGVREDLMGLFGRKKEPPKVSTNAPKDWPAVSSWVGIPFHDTLSVSLTILKALKERGGTIHGMMVRRLYDDGVLTVPLFVEADGKRYGVFVYGDVDADTEAHFSGVRSVLRQREDAIAIYYASGPIQPAKPAQVVDLLAPDDFSAASEEREPAEYALFWPTEEDETLAASPALGYLDRWFEAFDGRAFVFLSMMAKVLELGDEDDESVVGLPVQDTMIAITGPDRIELYLHASQSNGLWFAFDTRTPAARRNLLLKHLAEAAELVRGSLDQNDVEQNPDEQGVLASWHRRRDEYLERETKAEPGLRLGIISELGGARLSDASVSSEKDRQASAATSLAPSEALAEFVRGELGHAFDRVRAAAASGEGGPNLQAFVAVQDGSDVWRTVLYLTNEPEAIAFTPEVVADHPGAACVALVCDGYLRMGDQRFDAIVVRAQERSSGASLAFAQRYSVERDGQVALLGNWMMTGQDASLWPAEMVPAAEPSPRLKAFVAKRLEERLSWLGLRSPDDEPIADDDVLLSPHLEHMDAKTITVGFMMMGLASALLGARKVLAEATTCELASLEYDEPTTRNGRPARSIRFWVHERGTPHALLYSLPYEPPARGTAFKPTGPLTLVRAAPPLFPS